MTFIRADQNTGSALLESPMGTAMQGKSRVSSVISIELNRTELVCNICFTIINKISDSFRIYGGSPVGRAFE